MNPPECRIDELGPLPVVRPSNVSELSALVRECSQQRKALYPFGAGTKLGLGNPPGRQGVAVDLRSLDQVIDYPARDMTITVQTCVTVARLQKLLVPENQQLPIDVPQADRATLGGILATNTSGSRRYGYGTLRDYVLGISAVNDEGKEIKAGGRVVKNVAGYDLCKLFIGSLGTLGIITQVTLKVRPLPEERALVALTCAADGLGTFLDRLHASRTRPVCLDVLNRPAARWLGEQAGVPTPAGDWVGVVGYEGNADLVNWQVQQLIKELRADYTLEARVGFPTDGLWQALAEFARGPDAVLTFKASVLPSAVASFCRQATALSEALSVRAHAGNGIVVGHLPRGLTKECAAEMVKQLRTLITPGQGSVIVLHCPAAWKDTVSVWGPAREDWWLMRKVKEQLDPRGLFNPGRFVDGI
jgi:glycolate oxidase FAD binding subunit